MLRRAGKVLVGALAAMTLSMGCGSGDDDAGSSVDLVILHARVLTASDREPYASAVAVRGERIAYVGSSEGAQALIGGNTQVIEAGGRVLVPGFIDNHTHLLWLGALQAIEAELPLIEQFTYEEMVAVVRQFAQANPDNPFVMTKGWRYSVVPGGMPDKHLADEIISDRPLVLWSEDGHTGWVNSMMLDIMQTRNPKALQYLTPRIDPGTGEPTGLLLHFFEFNPFDFFPLADVPPSMKQRMFDQVLALIDEALKEGVTAVHDVQIYKSYLPWVEEFLAYADLKKMRVKSALYMGPVYLEKMDEVASDLAAWQEFGRRHSTPYMMFGDSVKMYMDGTSQNHTAYWSVPYADDPSSRGFPVWNQEDYDRVIEIIDGSGQQILTHGCGDAAIHMIVDGYDHVRQVNGERDSRHRIEHCETPAPSDQERMAALGVYAAMQPLHFFGSSTLDAALGPDRFPTYMPWRDLEQHDVNLSFGTDWPPTNVPPVNPLYGLLMATTRWDYTETIRYPEEAIAIEDAIAHYTMGSAKALKLDREIGSIETGKYADFALFSIDPRAVATPEFLFNHPPVPGTWDDFVILTAVGGKIVYKNPSYPDVVP